MIKRSPRRNPRSKGIKLKHGLQICLLLGVCFWLIYQVKHSHDKKKELDEKDANLSLSAQHHDELPKLGRKDLHPDLQDKTRSEKPEEEEEEDTGVDEEVNKKEEKGHEKEKEEETKHEEGEGGIKDEEMEREEHIHEEEEREGEGTNHLDKEREEEIRHEEEEQTEEADSEETEDKGRQGGDDEVDEHDQEKIEGEADRDEEFMDEEKEREDEGEDNEGEEKESQGNEGEDNEDREVQADNETQSEDQDHDEGGKNSHEAREEHYKADDASSAVTHDTQIISTEPEKEGLEKSNENLAENDLQQDKYSISGNPLDVNEDKINSTSQLEQAENGHPLNVTIDEKQNDKITLTKSEDESPNNTTVTVLSNDQLVPSNKSMEVSSEAGDNQAGANLGVSGSSQQNGTWNASDSNQIQNATIDGRVTGDVSNIQTTQLEQVNNGMVYNSIDSSNSSSNSDSGVSDKIIKPELTVAEDVNSGLSSRTNESTEATHDGSSDTKNESGGTDENTISSNMKKAEDAILHDPIDSSVGQDEREARIDLGTLPETGTGGVSSGNAAEE
ncbi:PREDICTED: high mobility group nucleosome-binding domain-containing protein 5-like [Populus euphratica]|uniref:High mobility group nucleosome-binding domain-containing protein 5-like n=1 Tax=Populus euphratica TaxID=75702 RepID=A0AAJ6T0P8_POPEU|nr:PREDICTED: high mobility group nucleosome-binding domain-containing protein 5-like [Populus euphratica]